MTPSKNSMIMLNLCVVTLMPFLDFVTGKTALLDFSEFVDGEIAKRKLCSNRHCLLDRSLVNSQLFLLRECTKLKRERGEEFKESENIHPAKTFQLE